MNEKFCPKCGATGRSLVKGFCLDCFLHDHPEIVQLDKEIELGRCKKCGKIRVKGKWVEEDDESLAALVLSKLKLKEFAEPEVEVDLEWLDDDKGNYKAEVEVQGKIEGHEVKLSRDVLLKAKSVVCDPCMRVFGQYREAILQVRDEKQTSKEEFQQVLLKVNRRLAEEGKKDPLARAIEVHWQKNGFDVWIGSKHAARVVAEALAREFKTKVTTSSKLLGQDKEGKEKYRFTYCVRFKEKKK